MASSCCSPSNTSSSPLLVLHVFQSSTVTQPPDNDYKLYFYKKIKLLTDVDLDSFSRKVLLESLFEGIIPRSDAGPHYHKRLQPKTCLRKGYYMQIQSKTSAVAHIQRLQSLAVGEVKKAVVSQHTAPLQIQLIQCISTGLTRRLDNTIRHKLTTT